MRGVRVRMLRKLVTSNPPDVNFLASIRNIYGEQTKDMMVNNLYKLAKKHWRTHGLKDNWGKN